MRVDTISLQETWRNCHDSTEKLNSIESQIHRHLSLHSKCSHSKAIFQRAVFCAEKWNALHFVQNIQMFCSHISFHRSIEKFNFDFQDFVDQIKSTKCELNRRNKWHLHQKWQNKIILINTSILSGNANERARLFLKLSFEFDVRVREVREQWHFWKEQTRTFCDANWYLYNQKQIK